MSSYLAEQFNVIPIATRVLLLEQEVKMLWKTSKIFILIHFHLKFLYDQIINRFDLAA